MTFDVTECFVADDCAITQFMAVDPFDRERMGDFSRGLMSLFPLLFPTLVHEVIAALPEAEGPSIC